MSEKVQTEQSRLISMFSHEPSQVRASPLPPSQLAVKSLTFQFDSIEWKVQHFYQSCKSLEYIEADREKPLMKIINNLGGERTVQSKPEQPGLTVIYCRLGRVEVLQPVQLGPPQGPQGAPR